MVKYLACALVHNACRQGYKVYYSRLKAPMVLCSQGHADGRYSKLLTKLNHSDLLLLDDRRLEPVSSEQRSDLLEIVDDVSARFNHRRKPVAGGR